MGRLGDGDKIERVALRVGVIGEHIDEDATVSSSFVEAVSSTATGASLTALIVTETLAVDGLVPAASCMV